MLKFIYGHWELANIAMYSPRIDQHTPNLYRLAKVVGKPMTKVADELISYSFKHLETIYQLSEQEIADVIQKNQEKAAK